MPSPPVNPITALIAWRLKRRFDNRLDDPEAYATEVAAQRAAYPFPEWDMAGFVFPLLAYAALAHRRGRTTPEDIERMAGLVRLAIRSTVRFVGPPRGDLEQAPLWLRDVTGKTRLHREAVHAHLTWLAHEGSDPETGLPWSMVPMDESGFSHGEAMPAFS